MKGFFLALVGLCCVSVGHGEYGGQNSDALEEALMMKAIEEVRMAMMEEARQEEEQAEEMDPEKMYRFRKEGQISVYNYAPSIRDQEYLEHSSLWGHQYVAGGAGEGLQRLKPDGSAKNIQVVKSDAVLPAYCNPPNPCPIGYTGEDGCLEDFQNTAAFSREYQRRQDCMCDTEHMFDCPGATKEDEVNTLARQISNEGIMESALDRIQHHLENSAPVEGQHKSLVAKKFFNKDTKEYTRALSEKNKLNRVRRATDEANNTITDNMPVHSTHAIQFNPYLQGEKLPVVAKKG